MRSSDSRRAGLQTEMARFTDGSNPYSPPSDWMLPSKINPTTSRFLLNTGEPELPPMMSLEVAMLNGVEGLIRLSWLAASQLFGRANGSRPVARSNAPPIAVMGLTRLPFSPYPSTDP